MDLQLKKFGIMIKNRISLLKEKFNLDIRTVWEYDSKNQNVLNEYARWIYE